MTETEVTYTYTYVYEDEDDTEDELAEEGRAATPTTALEEYEARHVSDNLLVVVVSITQVERPNIGGFRASACIANWLARRRCKQLSAQEEMEAATHIQAE